MPTVVALIGTARPSPMPATAVLIPTTWPVLSASAPPEFPGFSAASVWMTFSTIRVVEPARVGSERPRALTTPAVADPAEPGGVAEGTDRRPAAQPIGGPRRRRDEAVRPRPHHRQVGERVASHDRERRLTAVHERRHAAGSARNDVRRRDEEPIGRDDHPGA